MSAPSLLALDIETTGLEPEHCAVIAVGLASVVGSDVRVGDEPALLAWLEDRMQNVPNDGLLITWNGEEFDLPFLRERFDRYQLRTGLCLRPRGVVGKYGKPLYEATWGSVVHVDIAARYRPVADELGIPWRLKPVARTVLGIEPVEVDNRGEAIAVLDQAELTRYLRSDIEITLALAERLDLIRQTSRDEPKRTP